MSTPDEVVFRGFERAGSCLRAAFSVVDSDGRAFIATALLTASGAVADVQASDEPAAGTTGRPEVDVIVCRRAEAELVRARSAATVAEFDRRALSAARRRR